MKTLTAFALALPYVLLTAPMVSAWLLVREGKGVRLL